MVLKPLRKAGIALSVLLLCSFMLTACNTSTYEESGKVIIPVSSLAQFIGKEDVVFIDMRVPEKYAEGHVQGAVNITLADIVINVPVANMLTSKNKIQKLLGANGIDNDTVMVVYDDDKMCAARFFWTMLVYGSKNVLVVDGGISAIEAAGIALTKDPNVIVPVEYIAGEKNTAWLADMKDVLAQVNEPDKNVILLDVRTQDEYLQTGKIPSSLLWDYAENFYRDGTFRDIQSTRINYINRGIRPENETIIYCKTSVRAAPVFLRLYDAGYRNIRIYDGAYLEWTSSPTNPIDLPEGTIVPGKKDAS